MVERNDMNYGAGGTAYKWLDWRACHKYMTALLESFDKLDCFITVG